jgi:hypothetical protein
MQKYKIYNIKWLSKINIMNPCGAPLSAPALGICTKMLDCVKSVKEQKHTSLFCGDKHYKVPVGWFLLILILISNVMFS